MASEPRVPIWKTHKLFIEGGFPRSESGRYLRINDAKGGFVAHVCRASRKDFRAAVVAARNALKSWNDRSAFNRGQILYRMAEMLEGRRDAFQRTLREVAGYQEAEARREVDVSVDRLVWYAGWADKFATAFGSTNPVAANYFNFTVPEPTGVVAVLAPREAPLLGTVSAIAPVLVGGSTVVAIIDHRAPMLVSDLAEAMATSDLPAGVVNLLTGLRSELAEQVAGHMDVDGILSFGSSEEERLTLGLGAAESVKRLKLMDDPPADVWCGDQMQSPYWILPFVEMKTAWHPIGV
jgi:acyl-CoA reductase-like NAD-dependent aldehyde dehydrogenase